MIQQTSARSRSRPLEPPSKWLAAAELPRAVTEVGLFAAALPTLLAFAPRGDGHPVLVLPGMLAGDASTALLRGALRQLGYDARGWGLGRNFGTRVVGNDGKNLLALVEAIFEGTGRRVSLVGWSLGGILARLVAQRQPELVRQVITLGSPIADDPLATNAWRIYEAVSGTRVDDAATRAFMLEVGRPLRVPSAAIFSKADGICAWQGCVAKPSACSENIEVRGSHCGLGANPLVLYAVADRLAQEEGKWKPFAALSAASWLFPGAGRS